MNFAVPFVRKFKYFQDKNCELNIRYKPIIKQLLDFIEIYGDHRINLIIGSESFREKEDIQIIEGLRERYPDCNLVICLSKYTPDLEKLFAEKGIPHYYQDFVNTWDKFEGFLSLDVTDIFVVEELAFSALFLSKKAKEKNKALRVFCNVCQSSWRDTPSLKTFFIRPEDIPTYANFVDVFELIVDEERQRILYKIYKQEKWSGKIDEIIPTFKEELDSKYMLNTFGEIRCKCNKRCLYKMGSCNICDRLMQLSNVFERNRSMMQEINKEN